MQILAADVWNLKFKQNQNKQSNINDEWDDSPHLNEVVHLEYHRVLCLMLWL